MWVAFANAKASHIFSAKILAYVYAIFDDQNFNDTLTNDIVSFEQLGPGFSVTLFLHSNMNIWITFICVYSKKLWD